MDFVFRGFYQQSGSHSSNYTYYTQQPNQRDVESYNGGGYHHFLGNRGVMMERQLEKEMIRREILAEEAARRRGLEAEVRRELKEEREMELRRRGCGHWEELPFERATRSYEKEELPFQRAPQAIQGVAKPPSEEERKQIIFVAEPDAKQPGRKRRDMSSQVGGPSGVTKKLTKEWTCALCQISATSELGLEDHFKGKKHKSKQAGQKVGMIGLCSKKIISPPSPSQVVESVELEKSQQIPNKQETWVENNEIAIVKEKACGGADENKPKRKKMKFKLYCKMCEVGAFSEEVMASHKKGKKHLLRLHQLGAKR